jgi:hypothetical protein
MSGDHSTNFFELNKTAGTNDNIIGMTSVTYGGTLVLANLSGTLANGDVFKLFTATNYSGAFASLFPASPGPGLKWNTNGLPVAGVLRVVSSNSAPPTIAGTALSSGTNFIITASGGVPYDPVTLLSATNVGLPLTNWIPLATNYFTGSGTVSFTNLVLADESQRFFALQVR